MMITQIESYKTVNLPTFSAILENLLDLFLRKVPKTVILGPKQAKKGNYKYIFKIGHQNKIPSYKTINLPNFSAILKSSLEPFLRKP